jgi:hypothetical protein
VAQRWNNLVNETGIAIVVSAVYAAVMLVGSRKPALVKWLPVLLVVCYLGDVARVNAKYLLLQPVPEQVRGVKTPVMQFLAKTGNQYRTLPMEGSDPMAYVSNGIPVMFTSNPVQKRRWQDFLDNFNVGSGMPDIMNVRYLVVSKEQYEKDKVAMAAKYTAVFEDPASPSVVLENKTVLPKAWLAPIAVPVTSPEDAMAAFQAAAFNPGTMALVESQPPIPMAGLNGQLPASGGQARVLRYEPERIEVEAMVAMNSMLILGDKYYKGWRATIDGKETGIYPVDHVLRGIYVTPGVHKVEFVFDPMPFKIGKYLTLISFFIFAAALCREFMMRRGQKVEAACCAEGAN